MVKNHYTRYICIVIVVCCNYKEILIGAWAILLLINLWDILLLAISRASVYCITDLIQTTLHLIVRYFVVYLYNT